MTAADWWDGRQRTWNDHVATIRASVERKKVERDLEKAETNADVAEENASFAVEFAYAAVEEAAGSAGGWPSAELSGEEDVGVEDARLDR